MNIIYGLLLVTQSAPSTPRPDLGWLAGNWISCSAQSVVEERWLGPAEGVLVGANLTTGERGASFDFFRVAPDEAGRWAYHAQPGGRPPVVFLITTQQPGRVVFENPSHDFPQRVLYWREGAQLHARIEGTIGGSEEHQEWSFVSNADGRGCNR